MSKKAPQSPKKAKDLSKEALQAIVKRLESGASTLFEESTKAGVTPNTPLRTALRAHLGGRPAYDKMIATAMKQRTVPKKPASKKA